MYPTMFGCELYQQATIKQMCFFHYKPINLFNKYLLRAWYWSYNNKLVQAHAVTLGRHR